MAERKRHTYEFDAIFSQEWRADPAHVERFWERCAKSVRVPYTIRVVDEHGELLGQRDVDPYRYRWGERGTRYDEDCAQCRRVRDIDNAVDLCQRCYGEPRTGAPY